MAKLPIPLSFDWDKDNLEKNRKRHKVHFKEAEEVFLNKPLKTYRDKKHSQKEERFTALGMTNEGRRLYLVFTIRKEGLRIISQGIKAEKKGGCMPKKKLQQIPKFESENEEREFWATHDFTDYLDQFEPVELDLSKLKPTTESISLRLPGYLLMRIKEIANSRDVPYQSLMKIFLAERVEKELRAKRASK